MSKWLPDFNNITVLQPINKQAELRRQQAKKEAGIVTANDILLAEIYANKNLAIKSVLKELNYQQQKLQWDKQDELPIAQEIVGDIAPGYSTYKFAKNASRDFGRAGQLLTQGYIRPALGYGLKGIGNFGFGVASLIPFTGTSKTLLTSVEKQLTKPETFTAYHRSPHAFNIKEFNLGTKHDFGLHVGDADASLGAVRYKVTLPKPNVETIDIHSNNHQHLMTDFVFKPSNTSGSFIKYDFNPSDKWMFVKEYIRNPKNWGRKFPVITKNPQGNNFYIEFPESFHFNLRRKLIKGVPRSKRQQFNILADLILEDVNNLKQAGVFTDGTKTSINSKVANLLHDNGINVIKYNNHNYWEGYKPSYIITHPDVIINSELALKSGGTLNYLNYFK